MLSFRVDEAIEIHRSDFDGCKYAVMYKPQPLPSIEKHNTNSDGESVWEIIIICARRREGKWEWENLDNDAKDDIGDYLMKFLEFKANTWYYLEILSDL